ncbi:HAD family hydrolase [Enemella evansiae]|uniref:Beta-phosphoglucomutase n=1 Tax=Enemella evansiae TaxID=2016499 RepID=A0A255GBY4_9ACTN|nr:beta-phosphoglucomutase family hydrolase [Enemella evansiae]PFG65995.1 HAD superfamily hydrolase (TIGR01509 family)/beta-phosphoglucomutase family hydrolase [Propionibacteriaceae bacterium ES.041]OYN99752.1 haloacid dehalogenase [Enemella evansiae]OYO00148.1 haloacid dehalogenase [Enemella evansiae]OYO04625.1 haloacid dehalogenase [Enemella evansiae]OYO09139.1 haloacid dehalogenase [Enemella evansiae]
MHWDDIDACLFDLDGVITPTAEVHMRAWDTMFSEFLAARGAAAYTSADYFDHVDGRPRYEGVATLLEAKGIELPQGEPSDPPEAETISGLGNRKDKLFNEILAEEGIQPYPGSVRLLDALAERGTEVAIVSSSKNARAVLEAAGLLDRFEVIIDGQVAAAEGLPGKPQPDTFLAAAERVGVPKERAVVFEDALSGVRAGAAGDFGLVVGVDRGTGADRLREAGADVVVGDLDELVDSVRS